MTPASRIARSWRFFRIKTSETTKKACRESVTASLELLPNQAAMLLLKKTFMTVIGLVC